LVFLATAWLLIRGGQVVGPHLALLSNYFPGYHVSWPGALVGLVYGAMCGAVAGWSVAWVYNLVVAVRQRP
jgi:ribose/xylose/arabinose/galactoside ABC-type transport system permease subunit